MSYILSDSPFTYISMVFSTFAELCSHLGKENDYPLQSYCLDNPMDRGAYLIIEDFQNKVLVCLCLCILFMGKQTV